MKSLRLRLFVAITGVTVIFVSVSALLNTLFLDRYYRWEKETNLKTISQEIDKQYTGDPDQLTSYLIKLERTSPLRVIILNDKMQAKYDTINNFSNKEGIKPPHEMFSLAEPKPLIPGAKPPEPNPLDKNHTSQEQIIEPNLLALEIGNQVVTVNHDRQPDNNFINLVSKLHNGDYLILNTPLAALEKNSIIANRFFLFTGLITLIFGLGAALFLSDRFTRPIRELNHIANEMAELRFETLCTIDSEDEIGQLASNINSLSGQLNHAINELRTTNWKLRQDVDRERKIDQMRKEFISNVSHEMKTPIALIEGYAEGLKLNINQGEDTKNEYCDIIIDETARMNRLINNLLALSKLESGYFDLQMSSFDINGFISQQLIKFKPILELRDIDISWHPGECPPVVGDEFYIEQVFTNFINNAINYAGEPRQIRVSTRVDDNKAKVTIWNSGSAIPPEEQEKIWTPFYKLDSARTRSQGGTGLGLSIIKAIQELHGNTYGVNNTDDGVEFWFTLDIT